MIARGFKPVGWVAAVATAALGCYMLSLNVAAERAELSDVEQQIILTKREIRALQTELGTRGRLQQLEHWNADVLALSAPASGQFLNDEFTLARYSEPQKSFEDRARVRMASVEAAPAQPAPQPSVGPGFIPAPAPLDKPVVRQASLVVGEAGRFKPVNAAPAKAPVVKQPVPKAPLVKVNEAKPAVARAAVSRPAPKLAAKPPARPAAKAPAKSASLIPSDLAREIAQASKAEKSSGGAAGR
jgi:hypothetical protein